MARSCEKAERNGKKKFHLKLLKYGKKGLRVSCLTASKEFALYRTQMIVKPIPSNPA